MSLSPSLLLFQIINVSAAIDKVLPTLSTSSKDYSGPPHLFVSALLSSSAAVWQVEARCWVRWYRSTFRVGDLLNRAERHFLVDLALSV